MTLRGSLVGCAFTILAAASFSGCIHDSVPGPLAVEFAGRTATLLPGPTCLLLANRQLTFWVPKPADTSIEIRTGGRVLTAKETPSGAGVRFVVEVPKSSEQIEVGRIGPGSGRARWSLAVSAMRKPRPRELDVQGEIDQATQGSGKHEGQGIYTKIQHLELVQVRAKLDELENLAQSITQLPAESRYLLAFYRGMLADKEGDFRTALSELDRAIEITEHVEDPKNRWNARQKRALVLANLGRSNEAEEAFALLAKSSPDLTACQRGGFLNNWAWRTLLARESETGREVAAAEDPVILLDQAIENFRSEPKCPPRQLFNARLNLVLAHLQSGQPEAADQALVAARALKIERTLYLTLWELDLEARIDLARRRPKQALAIYRKLNQIATAAGSPDGRLRAALGTAYASDQLGDLVGALATLEQADALLDGQSLEVPLYDGRETFVSQREGVSNLKVRLLIDAGRNADALEAARWARSRVLRQFDLSERLANLSDQDSQEWRKAVSNYAETRGEIDRETYNEGGLLSGEVDPNRAERKKKAHEAEEALGHALDHLGRPADDRRLAPIDPAEVLLAFHPLSRPAGGSSGEWVAFAADRTGVTINRFSLGTTDLGVLSRNLLVPFRNQILAARRVRILPYGELRNVDFHALPFEGEVLLAAKPIVYGLDLSPAFGATPLRPAGEAGERRALIVANPDGTLPGTVVEADRVTSAIRSWAPSWRIDRLDGPAAQAKKLSELLRTADLLHFAGHGRFGGVGGSDSSLLLADDQHLTVGGVLTLPHAPRVVILSGCETGQTPEARVEGLGLANAFVLAGSRSVVASVGNVDDRIAASLFADLYQRWQGGADLSPAFQQALLTWRRSHPEEWKKFRLLEP